MQRKVGPEITRRSKNSPVPLSAVSGEPAPWSPESGLAPVAKSSVKRSVLNTLPVTTYFRILCGGIVVLTVRNLQQAKILRPKYQQNFCNNV
jgi:hypothetical protein